MKERRTSHRGLMQRSHYLLLKAAQRRFSMARFEMGILLYLIKEERLWEGLASSFNEFLHQERINLSAARQYMRVAEKLYFELGLTDVEFEALADVNMGTLERACDVITNDNKAEMIALMSTLEARDAKHEIDEMMAPAVKTMDRHPKVNRLLSDFHQLPHELRLEVLASFEAAATA